MVPAAEVPRSGNLVINLALLNRNPAPGIFTELDNFYVYLKIINVFRLKYISSLTGLTTIFI